MSQCADAPCTESDEAVEIADAQQQISIAEPTNSEQQLEEARETFPQLLPPIEPAWLPDHSLLRDRMSSTEPVTWVFAGDSDYCSTIQSAETFPRQFADRTKSELGRAADIFVNATHSGARLEHVRQRIRLRCSRLAPDVITLICGFADCARGVEKCEDFEETFIAILRDIEKVGAVAVVCTPPFSEIPDDAEEHIDRLIYIEAIRGCVAEHSGILVDHWERWLSLPRENDLWNTESNRLTLAGIREMENLYVAHLGMKLPSLEASNPPTP